jgi:hypothetical protein
VHCTKVTSSCTRCWQHPLVSQQKFCADWQSAAYGLHVCPHSMLSSLHPTTTASVRQTPPARCSSMFAAQTSPPLYMHSTPVTLQRTRCNSSWRHRHIPFTPPTPIQLVLSVCSHPQTANTSSCNTLSPTDGITNPYLSHTPKQCGIHAHAACSRNYVVRHTRHTLRLAAAGSTAGTRRAWQVRGREDMRCPGGTVSSYNTHTVRCKVNCSRPQPSQHGHGPCQLVVWEYVTHPFNGKLLSKITAVQSVLHNQECAAAAHTICIRLPVKYVHHMHPPTRKIRTPYASVHQSYHAILNRSELTCTCTCT